jgi:hypothetical protein
MKKRILKLISDIEELQNNSNNSIPKKSQEKKLVSTKYSFSALKATNNERQLNLKSEMLREFIFENISYNLNKSKHDKIIELVSLTKDMSKNIIQIKDIINSLNFKENINTKNLNIITPIKIPAEIKEEVNLDIKELNNAFNSGCYRASIILCGRILETCLHRIYYDITKKDLLEKSPGIGLGNLIGKIRDQGINLDPGLTQQIHLVNNVRIFSVHKKKQLFMPTKQQTYATILYTSDIINRMF